MSSEFDISEKSVKKSLKFHSTDKDAKKNFFLKTASKVIIERTDEHEKEPEAIQVIIRWCTLCDNSLESYISNEEHLQSKIHKKNKNYYRITTTDEKDCILTCTNTKLASSRLQALKRRCKKIRQRMTIRSLKHESDVFSKEVLVSSPHRKRLQKISIELDKLLSNQSKDYAAMDVLVKEILKIVDNNNENDLHLIRSTRIIHLLVEICKSIHVCHKKEYRTMVILLNCCTRLLVRICSNKQNRSYMLLTNSVIPLVDLL